MRNIEHICAAWRELLVYNGITHFEDFWQIDAPWFEEPNYRRGGWSGVVNMTLRTPGGDDIGIFIKRQENHIYRGLRHGFRAMPTFAREYHNIQLFQKHSIPTVEWLYFGQRMVDGCMRAILVTRQLEGYQPLDAEHSLQLSRIERKQLMESLAVALHIMHLNHVQHSCLYPKHIFFKRLADGQMCIRFIDLEKARWRWFEYIAALRDISTMHRHSPHIRRADKLLFFKAYCHEKLLSHDSKVMLTSLLQRKVKSGTGALHPLGISSVKHP